LFPEIHISLLTLGAQVTDHGLLALKLYKNGLTVNSIHYSNLNIPLLDFKKNANAITLPKRNQPLN